MITGRSFRAIFVSLDNLLTVEPRPRNALLSDILKRIGLAERTGRGIDRIFEENLRYGRRLPDYSESSSDSVRVFFPKCDPDLNFFNLLISYQRETGKRISIYGLRVLSAVLFAKKMDFKGIIAAVHLPELRVKRQLESLLQDGLLETRGSASRREFVMGPKYYETQQSEERRIRGNSSSSLENEERILQLARSQGTVTRGDVMLLLGSDSQKAYRLLFKLVRNGKIVREGDRRKAVYRAL